MVDVQQSDKPFGRALRDLLVERDVFVTGSGNVNWSELAAQLPTVHYETLRKAVSGNRTASPSVVEEVAEAIGVSPEYFVEYRLWQFRREFDVSEVGWDAALENARRWVEKKQAS